MKHWSEYRSPRLVRELAQDIQRRVQAWQQASGTSRPLRLIEVCGGQTHSIARHGLESLLGGYVHFVHGPGCPVCVTAASIIDRACEVARLPGVVMCSYGDMLRVPGNRNSLLDARAQGARVHVVETPTEALTLALQNREDQVVLLCIGFETTAPANAFALHMAREIGLGNLSALVAQVRLPPVLERLLSEPDLQLDGVLAAGHVCAISGLHEYDELAKRHGLPIVVTGFEPADILLGVSECVERLHRKDSASPLGVTNAYSRMVSREGNITARTMVERVFEVCDREWRGLGVIPCGGLCLNRDFVDFDAETRLSKQLPAPQDHMPRDPMHPEATGQCLAGQVLCGRLSPRNCPSFATRCTPETPLGAPMVSGEGACAAYYRYQSTAESTVDSAVDSAAASRSEPTLFDPHSASRHETKPPSLMRGQRERLSFHENRRQDTQP